MQSFFSPLASSEAFQRFQPITPQCDPSLGLLAAYHTALNSVANICVTDNEGTILFVNDNFCAARGYSREELLGSTNKLLSLPEKEYAAQLAAFKETLDQGQTWRGKIANRRKNGDLYYANVSIVPGCEIDGQVKQYYVISYDVTDEVLAHQQLVQCHEELRESHDLLQTIVSLHQPDWVWELDANLRYTSVKSGDGKIHVDYLIGKLFWEAAVDRSDYKWLAQQERMQTHSNFWDFEYSIPQNENSKALLWLSACAEAVIKDGVFCGYRGVAKDITERRVLEQRLWELLHLDSLTKLANRNYFKTLLDRKLQARGEPFALVLLDLDDFNVVNATMGSAAGDMHLQLVADSLKAALPSTDVIARVSGDEFALILDGARTAEQAREWLDYLVAAVDRPYAQTQQGRCLISAGVSLYPVHGATLDHMFRAAELALRKAKTQGGGRYAFFEEAMLARTLQNQILSVDVHQAIDIDKLCVQYQPIVHITSGKVCSLEALMFCEHASYPNGRIGAGEIMKLSKDSQLWAKIGHRVVDKVLAQIAKWKQDRVPFGKVAINVTSADFTHGNITQWLANRMAHYRVRPTDIIIELTEGICFLGEESAIVKEGVHQIDEMGIELAFDDFGTGHASLQDLPLPISRVKIDRSFVHDIETNTHHAQAVQAMEQLTRATGRILIIEGVETLKQLQIVCSMGCTHIQGYLFSKPLIAADVESLLMHFDAQRALQGLRGIAEHGGER